MRRLVLLSIAVAATASLSAQSPAALDWTALDAETLKHFQAPRPDRLDRPANHAAGCGKAGRRLSARGAREGGHRHRNHRLDPNRPKPGGRLKGNGKKRPLPAYGPHRHGQRRSQEVGESALQRPAPGRLHLRPRHGRRQGQRRRHAHDPDSCSSARTSRSIATCRALRGREEGAVVTASPTWPNRTVSEDRGGVLPGRRRQLQPAGRQVTFASIQTLEKIPRASR